MRTFFGCLFVIFALGSLGSFNLVACFIWLVLAGLAFPPAKPTPIVGCDKRRTDPLHKPGLYMNFEATKIERMTLKPFNGVR